MLTKLQRSSCDCRKGHDGYPSMSAITGEQVVVQDKDRQLYPGIPEPADADDQRCRPADINVLLFHETRANLKYFLSVLRMCGLKNIFASVRLPEAIQYIISQDLDIIIVTHSGQAVKTTQLLEELRSLDAMAEIPVVAITADTEIKKVLMIKSKGVDKVMILPLSKQMVEDTIMEVLAKHRDNDPARNDLFLAGQYLNDARYEKANEIYMTLLSQGERLIPVYLGLYEVKCGLEQWDEAGSCLGKALELAKAIPDKIEQHLQLSHIFYQYGNYFEKRKKIDKALKHYRAAVNLNPFHTESIKALLELAQRQDSLKDVIRGIEQAREAFPPYSPALGEIAECAERLGQRFRDLDMQEEGQSIYECLIQLPHDNSAIHLRVADYFLERGKVSLVLEQLIRIVQDMKDPEIICKVGDILLQVEKDHMQQGKLVEAPADDLDLTFFHDKNSAEVIMLAYKLFRQALLLEPDNPDYWLRLIRCHLRREEQEHAEQMIAKLRKKFYDSASTQEAIIETLLDEGLPQPALEQCRDALARFPGRQSFYLLQARAFRQDDQPYEAIGCLKKAIAKEDDDPALFVLLAKTYLELGQFSDAISFYDQAQRLRPDDPEIQEGLQQALQAKYQQET